MVTDTSITKKQIILCCSTVKSMIHYCLYGGGKTK